MSLTGYYDTKSKVFSIKKYKRICKEKIIFKTLKNG